MADCRKQPEEFSPKILRQSENFSAKNFLAPAVSHG